ncbi:MAG: FHA domain-containing protein [Deltaproteobacteria bacterium]|nr:FHA domain-containing protein [Deltaproteobacteria bacterium]
MSAHVVPKAKPFPEEDEEEKTTIESGWEDEASTTVEQGEVADKIRALGSEQQPVTPPRAQQATGITSTGANQLDEPTVDDQHVAEIANNIAANVARLVITQGNDVGQEFEIRPGKSYTIGRAIDNDVVLTDIAVSRKHFDLRFQDAAWVIVDRGSGNGTVVNGNVEDNPFMLASGDAIEIGNTVFRFEQANGAPRPFASYSEEDEEMSTVAGKVVRHDLEHDPPAAPIQSRPKTLPPPTPIRPRSPSTFPAQPMPPGLAPTPASTLPLPQMAGRAPMAQPQSPTLLAAEPLVTSQPMQAMMQQPSQPYSIPQQRGQMFNDYPQYSEMPPGQGLGPLVVPQNGQRLDPSTAHVAPTPYAMNSMNGMLSGPLSAARPSAMPGAQLSKRTKMILGGVGLALLAGITTIAIVSGGSSKKPAQPAGTGSAAPIAAPKPEAPKPEPSKITATPIEQPKQDPPKVEPPKVDPPKVEPPKQVVVVPPPPKQEPPPKKEPPVVAKKDPPPVVKKDPPPKKDPPVVVKKDPPPRQETPKQDPPKKDPAPKRVATVDTGEARTKADGLYRAKRFSEAAATLASAAKTADDSEAKELRHIADLYVKVGRGLSSGTAPAAPPTEAFPTLRQTENFDRAAGGAFTSDIDAALKKVAPKAASAFLADKNYEQARLAVIEADKQGANTTIFKQALERAAADMYNQAAKEASSDAASAKDKCQRILNFADSKSPWYQKAARLKATL